MGQKRLWKCFGLQGENGGSRLRDSFCLDDPCHYRTAFLALVLLGTECADSEPGDLSGSLVRNGPVRAGSVRPRMVRRRAQPGDRYFQHPDQWSNRRDLRCDIRICGEETGYGSDADRGYYFCNSVHALCDPDYAGYGLRRGQHDSRTVCGGMDRHGADRPG